MLNLEMDVSLALFASFVVVVMVMEFVVEIVVLLVLCSVSFALCLFVVLCQ